MGEFDIIARYFKRDSGDPDVVIGVGDDAAVLSIDGLAAVTVDTLVAGVHFPVDLVAGALLGKSLAAYAHACVRSGRDRGRHRCALRERR